MDSPHFFSVSINRYLANIQHRIKRYVKSDGGSVVMENDFEISVSPSTKEELLTRLHLKN
jgi:two-component system LytT family response regulator